MIWYRSSNNLNKYKEKKNMIEEKKKYEKGTLGQLRQQQKIKAKRDGFDNIDDWLRWKNRGIEEKYGNEFKEWSEKNKDKVKSCYIDAGCKTKQEYEDKLAQRLGFKNEAERYREHNRVGKIEVMSLQNLTKIVQ